MPYAVAYLFLVLIALSALQVLSGIVGAAQPVGGSAGLYRCSEGFVNATLVLRDSLLRLYQVAVAGNTSVPQSMASRVSEAGNLSYDKISSMPGDECKRLYSDLLSALKGLASLAGIYLEPQANGAYERATLRAAEKLLERARGINASDIAEELASKIRGGNVSLRDLEDLGRHVEAREAVAKANKILAIARKISEERVLKPDAGPRDLEAVSRAEEVLRRVRGLLVSVNASSAAVAAVDNAIDNVSRARSILEGMARMKEIDRLMSLANILEDRIRGLVYALRNISAQNATAGMAIEGVLALLENASKRVAEARALIQGGDLGAAARALEEAYKLYSRAEEAAEELLKRAGKAVGDVVETYRGAVEKLSELSREFESLKRRVSNITAPAVRELVSSVEAELMRASNITLNISMLLSLGRLDDARSLVNYLTAVLNNAEAMIKALEKLVEGLGSVEDLRERLAEIMGEAGKLWERFQSLKANASNITSPGVRVLVEEIQRGFDELNKTISNASKALDAGDARVAKALIEKGGALVESIKKMLDRLEEMLREIGRGRR